MNLPNKLTVFRMILIPVMVVFMLIPSLAGSASNYIALAIFVIASLTDLFDGMIARKYNLITDFGKFMDPLADKLLVCCAMICMQSQGIIPVWVLLIIIAREFIISGFRLVASSKGIVIAADMWGKLKTNAQMFMVIFFFLDKIYACHIIATVLMYIAVVLTVLSLIDCLYKNREVLKDN